MAKMNHFVRSVTIALLLAWLTIRIECNESNWLYDENGKCRRQLQMFCGSGRRSKEIITPNHFTHYEYIIDEISYIFYPSGREPVFFTHAELKEEAPYIDDTIPTKILLYCNMIGKNANERLKDTYLDHMPQANILMVDWGVVKMKIIEPLSTNGAFLLANCLKELILGMFATRNLNNVHVIGHGTSAHAAGIAGRMLKEESLELQRITGLNAANPYMSNGLNKHDAHFVDVIHTNAENLTTFHIIGNADFYPNGGRGNQPDCILDSEQAICNDWIVYTYYTETVRNPFRFLAFKCANETALKHQDCNGNQVYMGEYVDFTARGIYYLKFDEI